MMLFLPGSGKSQVSFINGLGLTEMIFINDVVAFATNLTYEPRFNVHINSQASVGLAAPISLGIITGTGAGTSYVIETPLLAQANFGHASTNRDTLNSGGFIGVGWSHMFAGVSNFSIGQNLQTHGVMVQAGGRFRVSTFSFSIRVSFFRSLDEANANVLGLGALFNFGVK